MGIITKLSWRSLRYERSRLVLTVIAITIAVALTTASLVGISSAQTSLYNYAAHDSSGLVVAFHNVSKAKEPGIRTSPLIKHTTTVTQLTTVKYAASARSANIANLPVLTLAPSGFKQAVAPILTSGRLPRTNREAVVPNDINFAIHNHHLRVTAAGKIVTYRIVGYTSLYANTLLPTGLITYAPHATGKHIILAAPATFSNLRQTMTTLGQQSGHAPVTFNEQALNYVGAGKNHATTMNLIIIIAAVLLIIGGVALLMIYTSINLSVKAHRQRYGLLRSIGATPRQLRHLVYQESLILAACALVIGTLAGLGGLTLAMNFINSKLRLSSLGFHLTLVIKWVPLAIVALFIVAVTLLAAIKPAWRASRTNPIAAIRALDATPRITQHRLRSTWLTRHVRTPLLKHALRDYQRSPQRTTMLVVLTFTVMMFVSLTGFLHNEFLTGSTSANIDISASFRGPINRIQLRKTIAAAAPTNQVAMARTTTVLLKGGIHAQIKNNFQVIAVPNAEFKTKYAQIPRLVNLETQQRTGGPKTWLYTSNRARRITLNNPNTRHNVTFTAQPVAVSKVGGARLLVEQGGNPAIIVSNRLLAQWQRKLKLNADDISTDIALTLTHPQNHAHVTAALRNQYPKIDVQDYVDQQQEADAIATAMHVLSYGFITLLSLVSLATIINHTFADLLERRRSLAMLQSIGSTAQQVTLMLTLQHAILFGTGGVLGATLGSGISWALFDIMESGLRTFSFPLAEIAAVIIGLLLILLAFTFCTWRMLTNADIDQLIRVE